MPVNLEASIDIDAPVKKVFDYLTDPRNREQWLGGIEKITDLSPGAPRKGYKWRQTGTIAGRKATADVEIVEFEPDRKFTDRAVTKNVEARITVRFAVIATGTRVTSHAEVVRVSGMLKLLQPMIMPQVKKQLHDDLARVKKALESKK